MIKKENNFLIKKVNNQAGSLAVQFLFGWVLIMSFIAIFSAMSLTLIVMEITQYITYSSARQLFVSNMASSDQIREAEEPYKILVGRLSPFFKIGPGSDKGLFEIEKHSKLGLNTEFDSSGNSPNLFVGAWTKFKPLILRFNPPFWGKKGGSGLIDEMQIGSYLGREPSRSECVNFNRKRKQWILNYNLLPPSAPTSPPPGTSYDNDC